MNTKTEGADEVAKSVQRFSSYEMTPHKNNSPFIIPKRVILIEKFTGYKMCVSRFFTMFLQTIFRSDKYLASYTEDANRNECRSAYQIPVIGVRF
jgi:hypothetical protein